MGVNSFIFVVAVVFTTTPEFPTRLEPVSIREVTLVNPPRSSTTVSSTKWTVIRFINLTAADLVESETTKSGVFVDTVRCSVVWYSGGGFCIVPSVDDIDQSSIWYSTVLRPNRNIATEQKRIADWGRASPLRSVKRLEPFEADSLDSLVEMLPLVK